MKKRIISLLIAALTVMSVTIMPIFAITDAEAKAQAYELIQLIILGNEYSTDEDGGATILAMYPALAEAIKNDPALYTKLKNAFFESADEYTKLYTEEQFEGNLYGTGTVGIGVVFYLEDTDVGLVLSAVTSNSPAEKAGLKKGDEIIAVEGTDLSKLTYEEAYALLIPYAQKEGEAFTITVKSGDKTKDVKLTPAVINNAIDSVVSGIVETEDKGNVGYILVTDFYVDTPDYFQVSLDALEKQGVTSLIIDLRGNGGGDVEAVYTMLNAIMPAELPMYYMLENNGISLTTSDDLTDFTPDIVILTDENTASASEAFAGILQYNGIARLVGEKTFGKAIGQSHFDLGNGTYFAITSLEMFLPNGKNWNGKGLTPDVKAVDDPATEDVDEAFEAAVAILDDKGADIKEPATFDYYFNNQTEDSFVEIATVAVGADPMWTKDVRYIFRSENGCLLTMNCSDAYAAIKTGWYVGFYDAADYKAKLEKAGYKNFEVIATVAADYGFDAKITLKTDVNAKYFYYWDTKNGTYEAFTGTPYYSNDTLTFTTKKGGVIIAAEEKLF
jgi:carboxyl-terminal processing protease